VPEESKERHFETVDLENRSRVWGERGGGGGGRNGRRQVERGRRKGGGGEEEEGGGREEGGRWKCNTHSAYILKMRIH
jgi:hypothetical protein